MPQEIIIRGSTYSTYDTNARGPLTMPYEYKNNVKRFNEAKRDIYGGANKYGDDPYFNFGFRQPYVWTSLTDSDTWKYIKRFDSFELPIGSVAQDAIRMGKMLASGKGLLFLGKQFLLQSQAPFNETSLYNPLSVLQATLRPASLGLLPRPTRHVVLGDILSTFGFGNGNTPPPAGTTASNQTNLTDFRKSVLAQGHSKEGAGLIRARTANKGLINFDSKWGTMNASRPSFLTALISHFAPGLTPLPKQNGTYRSDEKSYDIMWNDISKESQSSILNSRYNSDKIKEINNSRDKVQFDQAGVIHPTVFNQPYYNLGKGGSNLYDIDTSTLKTNIYTNWLQENYLSETKGTIGDNSVAFLNRTHFLDGTKENSVDVSLNVVGFKTYEDIPDAKNGKETYQELTDTGYRFDPKTLSSKLTELLMSDQSNPLGVRYGDIPSDSKRSSYSKSGEYSGNGFVQSSTKLDDLGLSAANGNYSDRAEKDLINSKGISEEAINSKNDLILFFFKDLVNDKYVQFRACLSGISVSNNAEWENIRYLGRPDQVYIYKGFTQQLNFSFKIYPNNTDELDNLWKKVDYVTGFTQPAGYSNNHIVPPFISLTIGKLYLNQPVIVTSVNVNISDETSWDIDKELPHFIEVSVNADILQNKVPNISNGHFGFSENVVDSFNGFMSKKSLNKQNERDVSGLTLDSIPIQNETFNNIA